MAEPLARLGSFSYRYPGASRPALRGVDLELGEGELVLLAGRSGSGKSSLLRACCGLVPHYHGGEAWGSVEICGLDAREHGPAELGGLVGLVGQDPETQVVSATVRGELELPLELRGERAAARARAIEEVALALAIPQLLDRATRHAFGGRAATGRAGRGAGPATAPGAARRADLAARPGRGRRADRAPAPAQRGVGDGGGPGRAPARALPRGRRPGGRLDAARSPTTARRKGSANGRGEADPALATPAARLFSLAGLRPLPVGAKDARRALRAHGIEIAAQPAADQERRERRRRDRGRRRLRARDLWIELDSGLGPRDVVRELELELGPGERVALMGRNGAGKTTLLRAVAGLIEPARGTDRGSGRLRAVAAEPRRPAPARARRRGAARAEGMRALAAVGLEWAGDSGPARPLRRRARAAGAGDREGRA